MESTIWIYQAPQCSGTFTLNSYKSHTHTTHVNDSRHGDRPAEEYRNCLLDANASSIIHKKEKIPPLVL